ncbi:MAG: chromate efflux transporter [Proteobacteria bacterium]|nr:chromate efflux transporter [Pseudomonadota bacterium]MBU1595561.1 chromate efflux transporter [Pseudomonadota bacterium]
MAQSPVDPPPAHGRPALAQIFRCFLRVGATAYGGPAMMPLMREHILRRGWLTDEGFKVGLSVCQAVPGGTLMQMAAYTGLTLRGLPGALAGFVGFGLPAFLLITGLSALYHALQGLALTASAMQGLSAVVLGIIALAVHDFRLKYARGARRMGLTLLACGLFLYGVGPAWIILGAALAGPVVFRDETAPPVSLPSARVPVRGVLILAGVAAGWLGATLFLAPVLFKLSVSMGRADLIAFGGYGVFPALYHEAVDLRQWMGAATFMDGMALAQVTPGPFMLGACFVGYHVAGLWGALTAGIWIFTPSFFILMLTVPSAGRLLAWQPFRRALAGVLSTLGGLILAVGIELARGMDWSVPKAALCLAAAVALWKRVDPIWVVLCGVGLGVWLF